MPRREKRQRQGSRGDLQNQAASTFTGDLNAFIENVRKVHEQIIDTVNLDAITALGWEKDNKDKARELVKSFADWIAFTRMRLPPFRSSTSNRTGVGN